MRQKNFQIPKSKIDEISLPFSGGGPKMAHLEFRGKMPKIAKITIFPKRSPRYVSLSHKGVLDQLGCILLISGFRIAF